MNKFRNMRDELLDVALGNRSAQEKEYSIHAILDKYITQVGATHSVSKLALDSHENRDEILKYYEESCAARMGLEMLRTGGVTFEKENDNHAYIETYHAMAWVLK